MFFILLLLLGFITFISYIWLVVAAFKKSVLWGFLVLFLSPVTAIIFGILHWKDAKKPFLTFMLANVVYIASSFYAVSLILNSPGFVELVQKAKQGEPLSEEETAEKVLSIAETMTKNGLLSLQGLQMVRKEVYKKYPQLQQKNIIQNQRLAGTQPAPPQPKPGVDAETKVEPAPQGAVPQPADKVVPAAPQLTKPGVGAEAKVEPAPQEAVPQPVEKATPAAPQTPKPEPAADTKVEPAPQTAQPAKPEAVPAPKEAAETEASPTVEQATEPAADATVPAGAETEAPPSDQQIEQVVEEIEKQSEKSPTTEGRKRKQVAYQKISLHEAGNYIGKRVKIIDKRGKTHIGHLEKVESNRIIVGKNTGLIYSYDIQNVAIKTIMVAK